MWYKACFVPWGSIRLASLPPRFEPWGEQLGLIQVGPKIEAPVGLGVPPKRCLFFWLRIFLDDVLVISPRFPTFYSIFGFAMGYGWSWLAGNSPRKEMSPARGVVVCRGQAVQGGAPPVIRWFINPIMIFGLYRVILAMKLSKPTYKPG